MTRVRYTMSARLTEKDIHRWGVRLQHGIDNMA